MLLFSFGVFFCGLFLLVFFFQTESYVVMLH